MQLNINDVNYDEITGYLKILMNKIQDKIFLMVKL